MTRSNEAANMKIIIPMATATTKVIHQIVDSEYGCKVIPTL